MGSYNSLYIVWLFAVCLSLAVNTSAFALRSIAANSTYTSPPRSPMNRHSRRPSILPVMPTMYAQQRRLLHDEDYTESVYTYYTEPDGDYLYSDMDSTTNEVELLDTETPVVEDSTDSVYTYESEPDAAFLDI